MNPKLRDRLNEENNSQDHDGDLEILISNERRVGGEEVLERSRLAILEIVDEPSAEELDHCPDEERVEL